MTERKAIRDILEKWARDTRTNRQDCILEHHKPDALIFDVLPPIQYEGVKAYRDSWDEWQPETTGSMTFEFEQLEVTAGSDVGFAHGLIRCGGTTTGGHTFRDLVRATFCLVKLDDRWRIAHQHISKPISKS